MPDLPRLTIIGEALVDLLPSPPLGPGCYQAKQIGRASCRERVSSPV